MGTELQNEMTPGFLATRLNSQRRLPPLQQKGGDARHSGLISAGIELVYAIPSPNLTGEYFKKPMESGIIS